MQCRQKAQTLNSYWPPGTRKAVFHWSPVAMWNWWYAACRSILVKNLAPRVSSMSWLMWGSGSTERLVMALRLR